jgi:hypothetical protein
MPSLVLIVYLATAIFITACGISAECDLSLTTIPVCATDGLTTKTFGNVNLMLRDGKSNTGVGGKI